MNLEMVTAAQRKARALFAKRARSGFFSDLARRRKKPSSKSVIHTLDGEYRRSRKY